jgi:hypothetical protein
VFSVLQTICIDWRGGIANDLRYEVEAKRGEGVTGRIKTSQLGSNQNQPL